MKRLDAKMARTLATCGLLLALPVIAGMAGMSGVARAAEGSGLDFDQVEAGAARCSLAAQAPTTPPPPPMASCTSNDQCAQEEFCARLFGECEKPGKCEAKPKDCMEHGHPIVKPTCGCDGKTYDNACLAGAAGTSIHHEGPCLTPTAG